MHPLFLLYLGGIIPCFLFFLVLMRDFAETRDDCLIIVGATTLVSLLWPLVCLYLVYYLYENRR